jgi:hypothetical protein
MQKEALRAQLLIFTGHAQARIYARTTGARAQGGKFPGAAY